MHLHDGFYLRMALGLGPLNTTSSVDGIDQDIKTKGSGPAFDLYIGGSPVPGFVVGGALMWQVSLKPTVDAGSAPASTGGITTDNPKSVALSQLGVFVDGFPDPSGGFHIGGALTLASLASSDSDGNTSDNNPTGWGLDVMTGYDFWVGTQWSLGVLGRFGYAHTTFGAGNIHESDSSPSAAISFSALFH